MTIEEIRTLDSDAIEMRMAEIKEEMNAETADLGALNSELDAIEERRASIKKDIEERAKVVEEVISQPVAQPIVEERKEMTTMEIRNSEAYINAFANYMKTGDDRECRTLLSDNVQSPLTGSVPVPTFVGEIVAKRLEESKILSRVRRMEAAGNVKVGFEISAPAAIPAPEGADEPLPEEELVLGIVNLVPKTYKKWVSISDEALDTMSGEAYVRYIYEEVTRGIIKAEENAVIAKILAAPQTATQTQPAVAKTGSAAGAITDFVNARALLSSAAEDLVIICTPAQYATYRGLQMSASYAVDPFDGLEVLFSDAATAPIIGDLSGVMMNLPKGEAIEFKYDDHTRMKQDLVDILGRQPAAIEVVGNLFFAKVSA